MGGMALRYLARKVGIPVLRQASGPRVTPSACSGPLASRSPQAGYSSKNQKTQDIIGRVAEFKASLYAAVHEPARKRMIQRGMYVGSVAIGLGLSAYTAAALRRELELLVWERDIERELREIMEGDMDDEEMGESDMDGDKKK